MIPNVRSLQQLPATTTAASTSTILGRCLCYNGGGGGGGVQQQGCLHIRVTNQYDLVPTLPPRPFPFTEKYCHTGI
jgi:hypothetical protein